MKITLSLTAAALLGLATLGGCGGTSAPLSQGQLRALDAQVADARQMFVDIKPETRRYFDTAYGYAIFPAIKGGAVGVGGAGGQGQVFQGGRLIGTADITQMNVGAQLGGQEFAQVIFFENEGAMADMTGDGSWEFEAKASAVAADKGGSKSADYERGVSVFTLAKGGLMAQAAIGTQKLRYRALGDQQPLVNDRTRVDDRGRTVQER